LPLCGYRQGYGRKKRGAKIIKLGIQIMPAGQARGWSNAIRQVKEQMK
jgi:hypothetical protein